MNPKSYFSFPCVHKLFLEYGWDFDPKLSGPYMAWGMVWKEKKIEMVWSRLYDLEAAASQYSVCLSYSVEQKVTATLLSWTRNKGQLILYESSLQA